MGTVMKLAKLRAGAVSGSALIYSAYLIFILVTFIF